MSDDTINCRVWVVQGVYDLAANVIVLHTATVIAKIEGWRNTFVGRMH